ncbi:hypothetical protein PCASD_10227 [Puccinia coronata f. sp. avenae]|uniref:Uncharacterized protein n=1 Tax=Puccinia coronata f. sp. avenae TaxID=200324 RepID=A0A2N5UCZ6_9BASI|nr:hypothetical protein PCASD_10227 [Puccinia coronata f. sp. avenae]
MEEGETKVTCQDQSPPAAAPPDDPDAQSDRSSSGSTFSLRVLQLPHITELIVSSHRNSRAIGHWQLLASPLLRWPRLWLLLLLCLLRRRLAAAPTPASKSKQAASEIFHHATSDTKREMCTSQQTHGRRTRGIAVAGVDPEGEEEPDGAGMKISKLCLAAAVAARGG